MVAQVWLVQAGAVFVKRRVSCSLRYRNQRGDTERVCLRRERTAVVHKHKGPTREKVPSQRLRFPTATEKQGGGSAQQRRGTCAQSGAFTIRHRRSVWGHKTLFRAFPRLIVKVRTSLRTQIQTRPGAKSSPVHPRGIARQSFFTPPPPTPLSPLVGGGVVPSWVLHRGEATTATRMPKSERDPRPPRRTSRGGGRQCWMFYFNKTSCQSFESNSIVVATSGFKVRSSRTKLWARTRLHISAVGSPRRAAPGPSHTGDCSASLLRKSSLWKCRFPSNVAGKNKEEGEVNACSSFGINAAGFPPVAHHA